MLMFTYFTVPTASSTLSGASDWFNPLFSEFFPWATIAIGVILLFSGLGWLISHFSKALHH